MPDFDLAELYQIETRALNQAVKRNIKRFPPDFMFQLRTEEWKNKRPLRRHQKGNRQHIHGNRGPVSKTDRAAETCKEDRIQIVLLFI